MGPAGGDHEVGDGTGVGTDLLVALPLGRAELRHVAEHGDQPATVAAEVGEQVQRGPHRGRVGVVGVVADDQAVRALGEVAAPP